MESTLLMHYKGMVFKRSELTPAYYIIVIHHKFSEWVLKEKGCIVGDVSQGPLVSRAECGIISNEQSVDTR